MSRGKANKGRRNSPPSRLLRMLLLLRLPFRASTSMREPSSSPSPVERIEAMPESDPEPEPLEDPPAALPPAPL